MPALRQKRRMSHALVIANIDRAGDHAAVLGVLVLVAAIGGIVYGLVRLARRSRASRARSARGGDSDRGRDA
jgi:hypothetical protein